MPEGVTLTAADLHTTAAVPSPALLDGAAAAAWAGISPKTWRRWQGHGLVPLPVTVGSRSYWRRMDLERWVELGCPPTRRFRVQLAAGAPCL